MLLELGRESFDLSTRALVAAPGPVPSGRPDILVAHDATQVLELAGAVPVAIEARVAEDAKAALLDGADLVFGGVLADPMLLAVIADQGAAVVVQLPADNEVADQVRFLKERAAWAGAAGISRSRIIIEAPVAVVGELVSLHLPIMVSMTPQDSAGTQVAALMAGARVIRVAAAVQPAQRTAFTIGELLDRRGITSPVSVMAGGT